MARGDGREMGAYLAGVNPLAGKAVVVGSHLVAGERLWRQVGCVGGPWIGDGKS